MCGFGKGKYKAMTVGYFLLWECQGITGKALEIMEIWSSPIAQLRDEVGGGVGRERDLKRKSPQGPGLSNLAVFSSGIHYSKILPH